MSMNFTWPVRVYYEDTDVAGVVYYANYLKFMERARTEWLRSIGVDQTRLLEEGLLFVILSTNVNFLKPARFNDLLRVTCEVVEHTRTSFSFTQEIFREDSDGELLVEGQARAACLDAKSFRPRRLPSTIVAEVTR